MKKSIKDQILEITGMSEEEFYNTYPRESDKSKLIAKYGKKVEKLLNGGAVKKVQKGYEFDLNGNFKVSPAPLEMETYDFVGNQKAINKSADKMRKQNLRQGIGIVKEPNTLQNLYSGLSDLDSEDVNNAFQATGTINQNIQKVSGAIQKKRLEKERNKQLKAFQPLIAQAASSVSEPIERTYLRDDDPIRFIQPDTFHNPMGVGTNILAARNGAEIANTFAPNTIYKDLDKAQTGAEMALITEGINTTGDQVAWLLSRNTKKFQRENEKLMGQMGMQPGIQSLQSPYVSYMEDGGFVNPQVATSLEGIPLKKLFAPDLTMDTLRTGGNVRQNNITAMDGKMKALWGGGFRKIAESDYLPGSGEMVMIEGNSHEDKDSKTGQTGVGISVGDDGKSPLQHYAEYGTKLGVRNAHVEGEAKEPAVEKENPDGTSSILIYGNQYLGKLGATAYGDPSKSKMKIKTLAESLGEKINKAKKGADKAVFNIANLNPSTPYDLLTLSSNKAMEYGYGQQQAEYSSKLGDLGAIQEWINNADESGLDLKALNKGEIVKKAKMGAKITTAQKGVTKEQQIEADRLYKSGNVKAFQDYVEKIAPDIVKKIIDEKGLPRAGVFADNLSGPRTNDAYQRIMDPGLIGSTSQSFGQSSGKSIVDIQSQIASQMNALEPMYTEQYTGSVPEVKSKVDWFDVGRDAFNQVRPFILPTNAEGLSPEQISGELAALAANQLRPVHMQKAPLRLRIAQDISLQDQLAQNQSNYRAAIRNLGNNPTAISILNAQKNAADREVLEKQFIANQQNRENVYGYNLDAMNKNDLMNLQLMDQQYVRQEQALSNTKAVQQAALNSINAKILENRNLNKALQTYENLYNFRFDNKGRAYNVNPLAEFNIEGSGAPGTTGISGMNIEDLEYLVAKKKYEDKQKAKIAKSSKPARNGALVQAMKGSKLKDYK